RGVGKPAFVDPERASAAARQKGGRRQRRRHIPHAPQLHPSGVLLGQAVPAPRQGIGLRIQYHSGLVIFISRHTFEQLVENALDELPKRFADLLHNIAVIVEEEPSAADLDLLEHPNGQPLGIYRGTPLPPPWSGMTLI